MRTIKLIKNAERKVPETRPRIESAGRQSRLPKGVQSWVTEFKRTSRGESLASPSIVCSRMHCRSRDSQSETARFTAPPTLRHEQDSEHFC